MNVLNDMSKCFGCSACYNVCPTKSIKMVENDEGFLEPQIDDDTCIRCDKCRKVCPSLHPQYSNSDEPKIVGFVADKNTMKKSSSGGAFSVLAEEFLRQGEYVAGAVYDDSYGVYHTIISDADDLDSLRRSKYSPSDQRDCFTQTKKLLDEGHKVLYTGCPCQIAGLKNFLGKDYDSLVTIDLLCHGSAPQHLFSNYLDEAYGLQNIENIEMRRRDGWGTCVSVTLANGRNVTHNSRKDNYLRAYLEDMILRPTCYGCPFSCVPRQGDITLGDFWAAKRLKVGKPYTKRSSLVLLNSKKGETWWHQAIEAANKDMSELDLTNKVTVDKLNKNVAQAIVTNVQGREQFFAAYDGKDFEKTVLKLLYPFDVGMVLYVSNNFGSVATNFGLYKAVQNLGHRPMVLDNLARNEGIGKNFVTDYLDHGVGIFDWDDYHSANLLFDSFVVGSDQSWNWDLRVTIKNIEYFLMSFAADGKRKIAYAASLGGERYDFDDSIKMFYNHMLKRFNAISVREDFAERMCKKAFGVKAVQQIDPVFLIPREDYIELSKKSSLSIEEPFLFAYIRFPTPEKRQLIRDYAKHFGVKAYVAVDANAYDKLTRAFQMEEVVDLPQFVDWLAYYVNADYVITDSFHGTCFSLILQKKFMAFKGGTKSRFDSLARIVDGEEPGKNSGFLDGTDGLLGRTDGFRERDLAEIDERLSAAREEGLSWLRNALEAEPEPASASGDEADFNVGYARLLKDCLMSKKVAQRYQVEEGYRSRVDRKTKRGQVQLEAIRRVLVEDQGQGSVLARAKRKVAKSDRLPQIDKIDEYFSTLRKGDYTLLMSCNDDCNKYWDQFMELSGLPLKVKPGFHESYIAVVRRNKVVFEEASKKMLHFRQNIVLGRGLPTRSNAQAVYIASKGFSRKDRDQRSIVMIDNVDYAIDKRGINCVVINNRTKSVVDSLYIDLHVGLLIRRTR